MDQIKFLSGRFLVEYPVSLRSQKSRYQSRVAGRTREMSGKRNNGILMTAHRIHNYIDEITDKDSGKTQGL